MSEQYPEQPRPFDPRSMGEQFLAAAERATCHVPDKGSGVIVTYMLPEGTSLVIARYGSQHAIVSKRGRPMYTDQLFPCTLKVNERAETVDVFSVLGRGSQVSPYFLGTTTRYDIHGGYGPDDNQLTEEEVIRAQGILNQVTQREVPRSEIESRVVSLVGLLRSVRPIGE